MYILPPVLKRFRALYPKVDLTVTNAATSTVLDRLRGHELDLALLTLPIVATPPGASSTPRRWW
jgi:DNA-binding transcriptional LysR family regulator